MKTLKHRSMKALAIFLSVILVLMSLPLSVFADGLQNLFEKPEVELPFEKEIFEIKEERTGNTKTFKLEDGSFYIAQYDSDIHYLDETGVWQDIDNTLATSGNEISTKNAKIKFVKKTNGSDKIFTLHNGNQKLTLSLIGAHKKIKGVITNHQTEFAEDATKLEKMTTLDHVNAVGGPYGAQLRDGGNRTLIKGAPEKLLPACHTGKPPFGYRLEIRGEGNIDRLAIARKMIAVMDGETLLNCPNNYEVEIRVEIGGNGGAFMYAKLLTIKDERFSYRVSALPASMHPATAAAILKYAEFFLPVYII